MRQYAVLDVAKSVQAHEKSRDLAERIPRCPMRCGFSKMVHGLAAIYIQWDSEFLQAHPWSLF